MRLKPHPQCWVQNLNFEASAAMQLMKVLALRLLSCPQPSLFFQVMFLFKCVVFLRFVVIYIPQLLSNLFDGQVLLAGGN